MDKMKKNLCVNFALLILSASLFGQTSQSDLERLRTIVGAQSPILNDKNNAAVFPAAKPVKIYLAIKHNKSIARDFVQWVDEWNKTKAAQYGKLEIVDDLESADIAAAQFKFGAARLVREESVQMKIGKVPANTENDDIVLSSIGNSTLKTKSTVKSLQAPVYTYLIIRGQNSSWLVDYSRVDESLPDGGTLSELLLQSKIESRLKKR